MSSDAGSQTSSPASDGGGEEGRVKGLDERFGAIEAEQERQGGMLTQILGKLGGTPKAPGTGASTSPGSSTGSASEPPQPGPSIAEQVRRGVQEIEEEKQRRAAAEQATAAEQAARQQVQDRLAALERSPAEPMTGPRRKLQRVLFGKPDTP